ncbi:MAG: protoporphyrinogen oxidase HemJ [Myxococcota bacterium]
MTDFLLTSYLWIKAFHLIAVISWMAGLLYLPRLFVHHCDAQPASPTSETFKMMEEKLARIIMTPAMIATLVFGLAMLATPGTPGYLPTAETWLWVKLALVVGILGAHFAMMGWKNDFAEDRNLRSQRFYRIANEVPTLLMIGIVLCVIVKPF